QRGQRHPLELGSNLDGGLRSGLHRIHPAPPNDVTVVRSDRTMSRVVSAENERHSSFSHRIQIFRAEREHPAGNRAEKAESLQEFIDWHTRGEIMSVRRLG